MSSKITGALVCRGVGVVLIVVGTSSLLSWSVCDPSRLATAGWTSYSPPTPNTLSNLMTQSYDTYYVTSNTARYYLPSAAQVLAGFVMVLLSRPMGRWLAKGLNDTGKQDAS